MDRPPRGLERIFEYSRFTRIFYTTFTGVLTGNVSALLVFGGTFSFLEVAPTIALMASLFVWLVATLYVTKLTLDDTQIVYQGLTGRHALRWSEIDDLHCSPRVISIVSTPRKKRLKIFRYVRGPRMEDFDDLQYEVACHLEPRLREKWGRLPLPLVCAYPGFPPLMVFGYVLAFGMALAVPVTMVVGLRAFG